MAHPAVNGSVSVDDDSAELASERIFIAVTPTMLADVEDYRFSNRFKSQSGAVRKLIELGLRAAAWEAKKPKASN